MEDGQSQIKFDVPALMLTFNMKSNMSKALEKN
jgi:hypothetical protein